MEESGSAAPDDGEIGEVDDVDGGHSLEYPIDSLQRSPIVGPSTPRVLPPTSATSATNQQPVTRSPAPTRAYMR